MNKRYVPILLLGLASAFAGRACAADLDIEDRSLIIPNVRIASDIVGTSPVPSVPRSSHAIEFGVSAARGSDTQHLGPSQSAINIGGQTFAPTQDVRSEFDFRLFELAYRFREVFRGPGIGVEALVGLGYAQLGLTATGATQRATERLNSGGFLFGVGGLWRITPNSSLQVRGTGFVLGGRDDVTNAYHFDLQFARTLGSHAAVRAGYSVWEVRSDRESGSVSSPIRLRFSGPMLGLDLMF